MMFRAHALVPVSRSATRRLLPLAYAATLGVPVSAIAQENATRVDAEMAAIEISHCTGLFDSTFRPPECTAGTALSEFAPDKFVVMTVGAISSVRQQFDAIRGRLGDLRGGIDGVRNAGPTPGRGGALRLASADTRGNVDPGLPIPVALTASDASDASAPQASDGGGAIDAMPLGLYVRAQAHQEDEAATSYDPRFHSPAAGATAGADYQFGHEGVVGLALDYEAADATFDVLDSSSGGHVIAHRLGASLYGAWYPAPLAYVDGTFSFGRSRYSTLRNLPIISTGSSTTPPTDTAQGRTTGGQEGLDVGGGYVATDGAYSYGPYARLAFTRATVKAFTELDNASSTNLSIAGQHATSVNSTIGVQLARAISVNWGVLVPNARLDWIHQFRSDRSSEITAWFASDAATSGRPVATVVTTPTDRNYFDLGLGLAAHFGVGRSAFIYFRNDMGHGPISSQAVTAELRFEI